MAKNYPKKVENKAVKNIKYPNLKEDSGNRLF